MLYPKVSNKRTIESILGPVLFSIFTNDLKEVTRVLAHKATRPVNVLKDRAATQRDLDRLDEWAGKNLRKSNKR